jgi:hypothetical protein
MLRNVTILLAAVLLVGTAFVPDDALAYRGGGVRAGAYHRGAYHRGAYRGGVAYRGGYYPYRGAAVGAAAAGAAAAGAYGYYKNNNSSFCDNYGSGYYLDPTGRRTCPY